MSGFDRIFRTLFGKRQSLPPGINRVQILKPFSTRFGLSDKPLPLATDGEFEDFTRSRISGARDPRTAANEVGRVIKGELGVAYDENPLIRETGQKSALEVFYDTGLSAQGQLQRFALCAEVTYLAVAMLGILGIKASCAHIGRPPSDTFMSIFTVKHMLAVVDIDGSPNFLDLTRSSALTAPYTVSFHRIEDADMLLSISQCNSAWMFSQQGQSFTALDLAHRATVTCPGNWDAWIILGQINFVNEKFKEAIDCYKKAISIGNVLNECFFDGLSRYLLGEALYKSGDTASAKEAFLDAVRIFPLTMEMLRSEKPEYFSLID